MALSTSSTYEAYPKQYGSNFYTGPRVVAEHPRWDVYACLEIEYSKRQCWLANELVSYVLNDTLKSMLECCNSKSDYFYFCEFVPRDPPELASRVSSVLGYSLHDELTNVRFGPIGGVSIPDFKGPYMAKNGAKNWVMLYAIVYRNDSYGKQREYYYYDPNVGICSSERHYNWNQTDEWPILTKY